MYIIFRNFKKVKTFIKEWLGGESNELMFVTFVYYPIRKPVPNVNTQASDCCGSRIIAPML